MRIRIVKSPYFSVTNDTEAEVEKIITVLESYGKLADKTRKAKLYVTKGLPNNIFRAHEIEILE